MSLHAQIMNLPRGVGWVPYEMTPNERAGYDAGCRDTRHAAAELALAAETRISDLEKALRELAETARGSVELDDWPELQAALANAEAL